ncbi:MAG TPA: hypothetical protein VL523_09760 [Terriglobia bacterium]|nr:hypothetical protein [Terriglobia bacterium]
MEDPRPVAPRSAPARRAGAHPRASKRSPKRFAQFVGYFKNYLGLGSVLSAALPIPAKYLHLIPMYAAQASFMTVYVSTFCFLFLGFIFYSRHAIARWIFRGLQGSGRGPSTLIAWLPLGLALASMGFLFGYHLLLQTSAAQVLENFRLQGVNLTFDRVLAETPYDGVVSSIPLMATFLGTFLAAETAFALMAIREYLQDILGLSDLEILRLQARAERPGQPEP